MISATGWTISNFSCRRSRNTPDTNLSHLHIDLRHILVHIRQNNYMEACHIFPYRYSRSYSDIQTHYIGQRSSHFPDILTRMRLTGYIGRRRSPVQSLLIFWIFNQNFWATFRFSTQFFFLIFYQHFDIWPKFQFLTNILIFDQNVLGTIADLDTKTNLVNFCTDLGINPDLDIKRIYTKLWFRSNIRIYTKTCICTKIWIPKCFFTKNINFIRKLRLLYKNLIFDQKFVFDPKFRFLFVKVTIFDLKSHFPTVKFRWNKIQTVLNSPEHIFRFSYWTQHHKYIHIQYIFPRMWNLPDMLSQFCIAPCHNIRQNYFSTILFYKHIRIRYRGLYSWNLPDSWVSDLSDTG